MQNLYIRKSIIIILKVSKQNLMECRVNDLQFEKKLKKVINEQGSWTTHTNLSCAKCQQCTCGKHKCKIESPHLALSPFNSTYNKNYCAKKPVCSNQKSKRVATQTYNPQYLISQSRYRSQYKDKIKQPQFSLVKPEIHLDNIKVGGPNFNTSSTYNNSYTPNKQARQSPVKNPQNLFCTPGIKLNSLSSYADAYKWQLNNTKPSKPIKREDHLKTEPGSFVSQSSYATDFQIAKNYKRERESFAPIRTYKASKGMPVRTSYSIHYCPKEAVICPAEHLN